MNTQLHIISAKELLTTDWPEPPWLVHGLLPTGLTLLAGRPKVGKSWLALQLVQAVASGGMFLNQQATQAPCLYLALEDPKRRLAERMKKQGWPATEVSADFITLGEARGLLPLNSDRGLALLDLIRHGRYGLVVIDTLARALNGDFNDAQVTTAALVPLQEAAQQGGVSLVLIDHHSKLGALNANGERAVDPALHVLGSTAKAAMADCLWALYRQKDRTILAVTGRDMEDQQLLLKQDTRTCMWQDCGDADAVQLTDAQKAILDTLKALGPSRLTTIARAIDQDKGNTSRRLAEMVGAGLVALQRIDSVSFYCLPDRMPTTPTTHTTLL